MRLIVTRPQADAAALALQLEAAGHTVILAPLLSIRPVDKLEVPKREYQAILITSANGARALEGRGELARLRAATAIVVGPASAEAAARVGFERIEQADGDVHALVRSVLGKLRPGDGPLLYISGAVTAGDLAARLQGSGFEVDRVVAYEARPAEALPGPCAAAIAAGGADGVVLHSPRSARIWAALAAKAGLSRAAAELVHYCLSDNVAGALREGLGDDVAVQVARRPNETDLLELIDMGRMGAGSGSGAPLRSRARVTEQRTGIGMAAKGTKPRRGRGKAAATAATEVEPHEATPEATQEATPEATTPPAETQASEPTFSPEAPVPLDESDTPDEAEREKARAAFDASKPRTAAPATGVEASPVQQGSWWVAAGLAAVLVAVALAGVWVLASGGTGRLDRQAQRLDALSSQVQTQTSRLDAAEQAISALQSEMSQMASSVDELQATGEANRQSLEQTTRAIENLSSDGAGALAGEAVGELQETLQSLDARVAGLEQGSELDDLTGRIGRLEEAIVALREQEAQRVAEAEAASALGRAYAALSQQIAAGEPFAEELEAVTAELPDAPGLETLRPLASEGAPTVAQLQARLEEIAGGLPQAEPGDAAAQEDGFLATMGERLQGMVKVQRAEEADMPAALDRALEALQGNDVEAAIAEIEQVSDRPSDEIGSWLADARKRRDAQAGLNELSDAVLRQFAGRQ